MALKDERFVEPPALMPPLINLFLISMCDACSPIKGTIISEKVLALQKERERLKTELDDTETLQGRAMTFTQLVARLVKLVGEMKEHR